MKENAILLDIYAPKFIRIESELNMHTIVTPNSLHLYVLHLRYYTNTG